MVEIGTAPLGRFALRLNLFLTAILSRAILFFTARSPCALFKQMYKNQKSLKEKSV